MTPLDIGIICFYAVFLVFWFIWGFCINAYVGGHVDAMFRSHLTPSHDHYTGIRKWAYDRAYNRYIAREPQIERRNEISAMRWVAKTSGDKPPFPEGQVGTNEYGKK